MLDDSVALITGASRGIGAATARLLAQHGAAVVVNYVSNDDAAGEVVSSIEEAGGRALAAKADVRDQAAVKAMVATVNDRFGLIDVLVLNAHIKAPIAPAVEQSWEDFRTKIVSEMEAAFYPVVAVVPNMKQRQRGCIVGISSGVSQNPPPGASAHSTAKSALNAYLRSLALELGPFGIRVNTVAPGLIMTDNTAPMPDQFKAVMAASTPLKRNGQPEDIAGAILMLAQDESSFITGTYLNVDGGREAGQMGSDISAVNQSQDAS